jgi:formyltetrahydrofolate synthetase
MTYKSDIEIAQETPVKHIREIAEALGLDDMYYQYKTIDNISYLSYSYILEGFPL